MVSTCRPSTITPVHRSWSRPPFDTRYSLSRVNSQSSATACPEGSTGRSRLCRRSKRSRTRHGPHERTSEPKAHARPSMWRPCSPDGEVCIGPRPPSAIAGSSAVLGEDGLSVRTYTGNFCYSHLDEAGEPWGATRGPRGRRGQPPDGSDGQGGRHAESPGGEKG